MVTIKVTSRSGKPFCSLSLDKDATVADLKAAY